jgi:hypothetical protein
MSKFRLPVRDKKAAIFFHCDIRRFTKVFLVVPRDKSFTQFQEFVPIFRVLEYLKVDNMRG